MKDLVISKRLICPLLCCLTACSTPHMMLDKEFREDSTVLEVHGLNGWKVNQLLSFGEYKTSKVRRSWTKGYDYPFIIRFSGAREKLSFSIKDGFDNQAEIFCVGKFYTEDLRIFHKYFDISLNVKDAFTGTVVLNESATYDFYVMNVHENQRFNQVKGEIEGDHMNIVIQPVVKLEGKPMFDWQTFGFEFVEDNEVVGAVETINQGKIWLRNDLGAMQKIVIASVASALLLRSELSDHNDRFTGDF